MILLHHKHSVLIRLCIGVVLIALLSGCTRTPSQASVVSTVNAGGVLRTSSLAHNQQDEHDEDDKDDKDERDNPVVYAYTVSSSEAFDIIDSLSPRCTACHRISKKGNANGPGPNLNGLKDRADSRIPGLNAREYIKQSIINPSAYIVQDCPKGPCVDVMAKNYHDDIGDDELEQLVNFLLSLESE